MKIDFAPTLKQHQAWLFLQDKQTTHILYGGSVGSGKSYLGCVWIILSCLQFPGTRYLIGRSRLNVLKRTTLKTFFDILKLYTITDLVNFNSQTNTLTFTNGSEVILMDLFPYPQDADYDRLGSLEITGAFIDELSEISYKGFEVLFTRIRYKLNEYKLTPKLFCASNPAQGFAKNFFYKPYIDKQEKPNVKFIPALPTDNPYLPPSYLDGLDQNLGPRLKQRLLYGSWDFDNDDYMLFDWDRLQQTFYNEWFKNTDDIPYLTCDIGELGGDKTIICLWKGWNLIQIKELSKTDLMEQVRIIKSVMTDYKIPIRNVIIDATGVGAGVASALKGSIRYMAGEKALNGEKFKNIKSQLMYHFARKVNDGSVNFNFDYDDQIIQEALSYKKEQSGEFWTITSKQDIKARLGRSPDKIDAIYLRAFFDFKTRQSASFTII